LTSKTYLRPEHAYRVEKEEPWKRKSRKKKKWKEEEYDEGERSRKKNNT